MADKKPLYLFLLTRDGIPDYDTYDSAVVVAPSAEDARKMHPRYGHIFGRKRPYVDKHFVGNNWTSSHSTWARTPAEVKVRRVGIATSGPVRVVCASFNAG